MNSLVKRIPISTQTANIVRGSGTAFLLQIVGAILAYLLQVFLARWIGQDGYGNYVFAYSWAQVLAVFGALGLTISILKFLPEYLANQDWASVRGLLFAFRGLVILAGSLLTILAMVFFLHWPQGEIDPLVLGFGLLLVPLIALKDLQTETIRGLERIAQAFAPPYILQPILVAGSAIFFLLTTGSLTAATAVWSLAASLLVVLVIQFLIIKNLTKPASFVKPSFSITQWLQPSVSLLVVQGSLVVAGRADVIVVGWMRGAAAAGVYSAASRTAFLISFVLIAVNAVIAPKIAPLFGNKDIRGLQALVSSGTRLAAGIGIFATLGMIAFSNLILGIFGTGFQLGQSVLIILAIGQMINVATGPVGNLMHLTGNQKLSAKVYFGAAVLCVVLNILLVPRLGMNGAAIATASTMALQNMILYALVRRYL